MCSSHKLVYGHFGATFDFVMIMRTGGHKNAVERSYLIIAVHVLWNRIFLLWFFLQGNFPLADSSTRPNTRIIMATVRGIKAGKKTKRFIVLLHRKMSEIVQMHQGTII